MYQGKGCELLRAGDLEITGRIPINTVSTAYATCDVFA
jgi:hypothetical protein